MNPFFEEDNRLYYLATLGSGTLCHNDIHKMVEDKDYEAFIECFVKGMKHQTDIGCNTEARIRCDLRVLIKQLTDGLSDFSK